MAGLDLYVVEVGVTHLLFSAVDAGEGLQLESDAEAVRREYLMTGVRGGDDVEGDLGRR